MDGHKEGGLELEAAAECGSGAGGGVVGDGVPWGAERGSERRGRVSLGELGAMGAQSHTEYDTVYNGN